MTTHIPRYTHLLKCDFCGETGYNIQIKTDRITGLGIPCCQNHVKNAVVSMTYYFNSNRIYPSFKLENFLGKKNFNIRRTNGELENDWKIDENKYIRWDSKLQVIIVPMKINKNDVVLNKNVPLTLLCEENNIEMSCDEIENNIKVRYFKSDLQQLNKLNEP